MFRVTCEDERFAHTFIDAQMIEFLVSTRGEFEVEVRGRWILIAGKQQPPRGFPGMINLHNALRSVIPPLVWQTYHRGRGLARRGDGVTPVVWGVAAGLLLLVVLAVASYNRFVRDAQLIDNSWSNVDTELRRRYDLVPNLVETVQGYAAHERTTFEAVTEARTRAMRSDGNAAAQSADENVLVGALKSLLAVTEAYPELVASQRFADLQDELILTENRIQAARRIFNANVRDFNTRVQTVPSNLVAKLGGFHERTYFEVDAAVRDAGAPQVRIGRPATS